MNTAAKRQLLGSLLTHTETAWLAIGDIDQDAIELHDPELNEHLVIMELARRHLADRATHLLDDLDDELDETVLEVANG